MDRRTLDILIAVGARTGFGLVLGVSLAVGGWFTAWFLFLRSSAGLTEAMIVFTASTGVFGGIGAGLAWIKLDEGVRANAPIVLLAVIGGLLGAGAGLAYAHYVFDVVVTRGEGDITAIGSAGIVANIPPMAWFVVDALRHRLPAGEPLALPKRNRAERPR